MDRQTRRFLLALALVIYDDLSSWDRDGFNKTSLYIARRAELLDFINSVYYHNQGIMWQGDFWEWWRGIEEKTINKLYGGR